MVRSIIVALMVLFGLSGATMAQTPALVKTCVQTSPTTCVPVSSTAPYPITPAPYSYTPLSPMQSGLAIASSTALTVPSGATYAVVCARSQNVNYSTDGTTTPTSSVGMVLQQNQCVALSGATVISNFRAIQQAATATLDVSYFR